MSEILISVKNKNGVRVEHWEIPNNPTILKIEKEISHQTNAIIRTIYYIDGEVKKKHILMSDFGALRQYVSLLTKQYPKMRNINYMGR
jgi:hypothetical protein